MADPDPYQSGLSAANKPREGNPYQWHEATEEEIERHMEWDRGWCDGQPTPKPPTFAEDELSTSETQ